MNLHDMNLPEGAMTVFNTLTDNGFECYMVGGVVRDLLLGERPSDYDFTTNAKPEDVVNLFDKVLLTGVKHGTVTVVADGGNFEVTTYRVEGNYSDSRHPDYVSFSDTLEEDLSRRDFTINAIACDSKGRIVDPFSGLADLKNRLVKCVGDPDERFNEDPLRMLRAIRFSSKLGFDIESDTFLSIKRNCSNVRTVSKERVYSELTKTLMTDNPGYGVLKLYETGLLQELLPEVAAMFTCEHNNKYHYTDVGRHSVDVLNGCPKDKNLRWAALLHDTGKLSCRAYKPDGSCSYHGHQEKSYEVAMRVCDDLRFSNKDKSEVCKLVLLHDTYHSRIVKVRRFVAENGMEFIEKLHRLQIADAKAHSSAFVEQLLSEKEEFYSKCRMCHEDGSAMVVGDLKVDGNDLLNLGYSGKKIGEMLNELLKRCIENPELNRRDYLMSVALRYSKKN